MANTVETDYENPIEDDPYEECTDCGKSIFPGVSECPYCRNFTDGKGPLALIRENEDERPRLKKIWVITAWVLVVLLLASEIIFAFFRG